MSLEDKRILVTGVTGFIGARLAEYLALHEGAIVTGIGRDLEKVPQLKEAGVELRLVDMRDSAALSDVVQGQDFIFHLAVASGTSAPEYARQVNVDVVVNLIAEAARAGASRFVHVSSIVVYGEPNGEVMAEDHPLDIEQDALYARTKALGELQARETSRQLGLDLTVIRPGLVFGPRGRSWTINLFKLVKGRVPVLLGDGTGYAQLVYVDNLIEGMVQAATRPEAVGEAFNFVDWPIPWREFFGYYGAMCGRKPRRVPLWLARAIVSLVKPMIGRTESTDAIFAFYTTQSIYPNTKAERLLGYRPRITIEESMKQTELWLQEAGYL